MWVIDSILVLWINCQHQNTVLVLTCVMCVLHLSLPLFENGIIFDDMGECANFDRLDCQDIFLFPIVQLCVENWHGGFSFRSRRFNRMPVLILSRCTWTVAVLTIAGNIAELSYLKQANLQDDVNKIHLNGWTLRIPSAMIFETHADNALRIEISYGVFTVIRSKTPCQWHRGCQE